jgi:excisionase family DNA binding protein
MANRTVGYAGAQLRTGLTNRTLRHLVATNRIPHIRYSARVVRFDETELEAWVATHRRGPAKVAA